MDIFVEKVNNAFSKVTCDASIQRELWDFFSFEVEGAKYMPLYRAKKWDGKIHIFNTRNNTIYYGLHKYLKYFAKDKNYEIEFDKDFFEEGESDAESFLNTIQLPFSPHDFQTDAVIKGTKNLRNVFVSPTGSGKSLIIYLLSQYFAIHKKKKTLLIVPSISLVDQMYKDFATYSNKTINEHIFQISGGVEKNNQFPITISTWQSVYKLPKSWFKDFDMVIVDECHLAKAESLKKIMSNCENANIRFGFTGTLDDVDCHKLILIGLFGSVHKATQTSALIERDILSKLEIYSMQLKQHMTEVDANAIQMNYHKEVEWLVLNKKRNSFIVNLATSLKGITLVLFTFVEKHGEGLYQSIQDKGTPHSVYFVSGNTSKTDREFIRETVQDEKNAIIVASYGTYSTGINIPKLSNIIFASPSKSKIRVLQSIGRGLRLAEGKEKAKLFDIGDFIETTGVTPIGNYSYKHMKERHKIYKKENFTIQQADIDL